MLLVPIAYTVTSFFLCVKPQSSYVYAVIGQSAGISQSLGVICGRVGVFFEITPTCRPTTPTDWLTLADLLVP